MSALLFQLHLYLSTGSGESSRGLYPSSYSRDGKEFDCISLMAGDVECDGRIPL